MTKNSMRLMVLIRNNDLIAADAINIFSKHIILLLISRQYTKLASPIGNVTNRTNDSRV